MSRAQDQKRNIADGNKLGRELWGLFAVFCGLLLILSLASFDSRDPWLNHAVRGTPAVFNRAGLFGSYVAGFLFDWFGIAGWVLPGFFCLVGARRILGSEIWGWRHRLGLFLLVLCLAVIGAAHDGELSRQAVNSAGGGNVSNHGGGVLGHFLLSMLLSGIGTAGTVLLGIFAFVLAVQMLAGFSWLTFLAGAASAVWNTCSTMAGDVIEKRKNAEEQQAAPALPKQTPAPRKTVKPLELAEEPILPAESPAPPYSPLPETAHHAASDPEGVPPWVHDFENGRLGVDSSSAADTPSAPLSGGLDLSWGEPEEGASRMEDVPVAEPSSVNAAAPPFEDEPAAPLGDVTIHEAATVEQAAPAPKPGIVQTAVNLLKKAKIPLPPLDLLEAAKNLGAGTPRSVLEAKGRSLMTCLTDFGIQGELVGITPGPVVTMFEVRPAPGVRVSRIANLSDDLALALKAVAVRIQAPVPGTDTVGIEIPNEVRETVCLKELLGSQAFQQSKSLLTLAVGKDIAGAPAVADLASMPHLLVAGATGAGKSVGINSIILSLIYKATPEEVQLLLIDPKRVEMAVYSDLPHLVHPVVTEMQLAKNALDWAVTEMEKRYAAIAKAGVRNIGDYNAKVAEWGENRPAGMEDLERIPYLVLIIDELADLMMTAAKEVETSIVRLAQLARAAGIHLILATQRPSVDVVTGLIKANFPCRMAFQVTSKHDSRTILDTVGAEHLLGRGDMLYKPGGGKFQRMHGAFVSDRNVQAVVDYWKSRQKPAYQVDFSDWGTEDAFESSFSGGGGGGDIASDPMYLEATEFVRQQGKASISLIQRKFRIGFNKAARLIEQMEQDGIVGPADGAKPRPVIR